MKGAPPERRSRTVEILGTTPAEAAELSTRPAEARDRPTPSAGVQIRGEGAAAPQRKLAEPLPTAGQQAVATTQKVAQWSRAERQLERSEQVELPKRAVPQEPQVVGTRRVARLVRRAWAERWSVRRSGAALVPLVMSWTSTVAKPVRAVPRLW